MARRSEITVWQLEVLQRVAEFAADDPVGNRATLRDVAASLGVTRQQVVAALERLEARTGSRLVEERHEGLWVAQPDVVARAASILEEVRQFEREARDGGHWWLRIDGYWAHMTAFLADAIHFMERSVTRSGGGSLDDEIRVELSPDFGEARKLAGVGMLERLERGQLDLVVAPAGASTSRLVRSRTCHRAALMVAVGPDHEVLNLAETKDGTLPVSRLLAADYGMVLSPKGHFSRELIGLYQATGRRVRVEASSPEPAALVALGRVGRRVAVVSSDSIVPATGWEREDDDTGWEIPEHWLALVDDEGRLLGRQYTVYYRSHSSSSELAASDRPVPPKVGAWLEEMATEAVRLATGRLEHRVERWSDRDLV